MPPDDRSPATDLLWRAVRTVVPWIALIVVIAFIWSTVTEYRSAVDTAEPTATAEPATADAAVDGPYVEVLSDGLNLRVEPSTTAAVVKVLGVNHKMAFIEEGAGWYHVRDSDGTEGWVAAGGRYTQLVQP
jgi:SH3-like domain-containing protein